MPKKKKAVKKITYISVDTASSVEFPKPECFGDYSNLCDRAICGKFYDLCKNFK